MLGRRDGARVLLAALGFVIASPVAAQLDVGVSVSRSTLNEVSANNRQAGLGAVGSARWAGSGWGAEATIGWQSLHAKVDPGRTDVRYVGGSLRAHYDVWRSLAVQLGFDSRTADPEFSAQDVATLGLGLLYETRLAEPAAVWIRGAALPKSWLSGGGDTSLGFDIGFGARVRPGTAGWGFLAEYEFQRLDRTVGGLDAPLQFERVRVGVFFGF